jgi:hypothetical protein
MKRKNILPVLGVIIALVVIGAILLNGSKLNEIPKAEYISESANVKLNRIDPKQVTVLFFAKDGDISTKVIESNLKNITPDIPKGVIIYKLNFDDENLRKQYSVQWPNTFVKLDKEKNIVKSNYSLVNWEDVIKFLK